MTDNVGLKIVASVQDTTSAAFRRLVVSGQNAARGIAADFKKLGGQLTNVRNIVGGIAAFLAVRSLVSGFQAVAEGLDKIGKTADSIGTTAESLQSLRDQGELAGLTVDQVSKSLLVLQKNAGLARAGGAAQAEQFRTLGLSTDELTGKQQNGVEVMAKVADALQKVGSQAERTRLLTSLFGDAGASLVPLLGAGGESLRKFYAEQERGGRLFSREQIAGVEAYNDSITKLRQAWRNLTEAVVITAAPLLADAFTALAATFKYNSEEMRQTILALADGVLAVAQVLVGAFGVVQKAANGWLLLASAVDIAKQKLTGTPESVAKAYEFFDSLVKSGEGISYTSKTVSQLREEVAALQAQVAKESPKIGDQLGKIAAGEGAGAGTGTGEQKPPDVAAGDWERFTEGARKATAAYRDFGTAAQNAGAQLVNGPLDALTDSLAAGISRTKSWGEAWKDLGRSVIGILAQVIAKLLVVKTVQTLTGGAGFGFGFADGGVMPGGVQQIRAFAKGGIVRSPTLALMGEGKAPAEAFVPLPDGRSIPVEFGDSGGGGGGGVVNVHISAMDSQDVVRVLKSHRGLLRDFAADDLARRSKTRSSYAAAR